MFSNVVSIRNYQANRLVASCEELLVSAEAGNVLGLLYITDDGSVGVAGTFRSDPSAALVEARKLTAALTMMVDAKILTKAI